MYLFINAVTTEWYPGYNAAIYSATSEETSAVVLFVIFRDLS